MKKQDIETLFFCRIHDFLYIYIPEQKNGARNTFTTYKQGLKTFRSYVNGVAGISSKRFGFKDCTYDFLLDYRNYLHVRSYMKYASARDISLQQYAFAVSQVPFYSTPKTQ